MNWVLFQAEIGQGCVGDSIFICSGCIRINFPLTDPMVACAPVAGKAPTVARRVLRSATTSSVALKALASSREVRKQARFTKETYQTLRVSCMKLIFLIV